MYIWKENKFDEISEKESLFYYFFSVEIAGMVLCGILFLKESNVV